mgnify:CR=1 FL=1
MDIDNLGAEVAEICVTVGFAKSKSEARRLITQGAIRFDDIQIHDPYARLVYDTEVKKWYFIMGNEYAEKYLNREIS